MIFNTKQPTKARSAIGYWIGFILISYLLVFAIQDELGAILAVFYMFITPIAFAVFIYWDTKTLGKHFQASNKWLYPFLGFFGPLGILLYLWDRERNVDPSV